MNECDVGLVSDGNSKIGLCPICNVDKAVIQYILTGQKFCVRCMMRCATAVFYPLRHKWAGIDNRYLLAGENI